MRQELDTGLNNSNWLIAFSIVLFASLPVLIFAYLAMAISGSINPLKWHPQIAFFVFYFAAIFGVSIIHYRQQTGKTINAIGFLAAITEMDEYQPKKPLDLFFSHYTNVATIGLLWGLSIYTYRSFQCYIPAIQVGLLLIFALVTISLVGFYAVFLYKLANKLVHLKSIFFYIGLLMFVFFVDAKVFEMIIKSVPVVSLSEANCRP